MILDSCFFIDLMGGDEAAIVKLDEVVGDGRPLSASAITITEVERGLESTELDRFRDVVADVDIVPYDRSMATRAASELRTLDGKGESIGAVDGMIATTALERDGVVLTRNVSEFRRVEGVRVVPY